MSEHTPEPWVGPEHVDRRRAGFVRAGDPLPGAEEGQSVAAVSLSRREWKANQRRIVAAINAVAGIPTEALEAGAVKDLIAGLRSVILRVESLQDSPKSLLASLTEDLPEMRAAVSKLEPKP